MEPVNWVLAFLVLQISLPGPQCQATIHNLRPLHGRLNTFKPSGVGLRGTSTFRQGLVRQPTEEELEDALNVGFANLRFRNDKPYKRNMTLEQMSRFHFNFRLTEPMAQKMSSCTGMPVLRASTWLTEHLGYTPEQALRNLPDVVLNEEMCKEKQRSDCTNFNPKKADCNARALYRTVDGSCNNLANPKWGSSMQPFVRFLQPAYQDGTNSMRGDMPAPMKPFLPSPRTVSRSIHELPQRAPRSDVMLMVMQWAQFLDHDITHTPEASSEEEGSTDAQEPFFCCERGNREMSSNTDDCRPIDVSDDPLHQAQGRDCMRFVRSLVASKGCSKGSMGPREQMNQITAFVDGSNVYGSNDEEARGLRMLRGGELKESLSRGRAHGSLLPEVQCKAGEKVCFRAGDVRVNEQPALTSMHTLWLRLHNNVAKILSDVNKRWDDETIYQETRRIVSALLQQVTYKEFLPVVLGQNAMDDYGITLENDGYSRDYDSTVDPTIANVFATAAYRFGHTLVAEIFKGKGRNITLRGNFMDSSALTRTGTTPTDLLKGLTGCPSRGSDAFLTPTLINHLFAPQDGSIGMDLMALNIQRGRDHGIPSYNDWRRACKLSNLKSWEDLSSVLDSATANTLKKMYKRVDDIDIFPAGLAESPVSGGILGPTFTCILGQQFKNIKKGDRFWYESAEQPKLFTPDQLFSIRRQSLSSLMCHNLNIDSMQPHAFQSENVKGNEKQLCSQFPKLNLNFWNTTFGTILTPTPPAGTGGSKVCRGVGVWRSLPGMAQWCEINCFNPGVSFCPPSHCDCVAADSHGQNQLNFPTLNHIKHNFNKS